MLKNVKGKMANWVLRAFLEVINHTSTKRGLPPLLKFNPPNLNPLPLVGEFFTG